jgi:hypothetical protein
MLEVGILKNFDSVNYKAGVQLVGSLTTYFDGVSVAKNIPSAALVIGNYVIVAIPGGNPGDACVIATWPQGSPGGGAGSFLDLSDAPSSYSGQADKLVRVKPDESGLEFREIHAARAYLSTNQTIPDVTNTVINLDTENYDTQDNFNPSTCRYTASEAGLYLVVVAVTYINLSDQRICYAVIKKNGADYLAVSKSQSRPTYGFLTPIALDIVDLAVDDYVQIAAWHNQGSSIPVLAGTDRTFLTVFKLT